MMDDATREMVEEAYFETVVETLDRGEGQLTAHKEGVVAASMLLAAVNGIEDDAAKNEVVSLNLRPNQANVH